MERLYTHDHVWVGPADENGTRRIGLTERAAILSGTPTFISFDTKAGVGLKKGDALLHVETDKWVGRVDVPFDCRVIDLNSDLVDGPAVMKSDPYGKGWLASLIPVGNLALVDEWVYRARYAKVATGERKTTGGLVRVHVELNGDIISCVRITGDFQLHPMDALDDIENVIDGCMIQRRVLLDRVARVFRLRSVESPGLSPEDIIDTLMVAIDKV